MLNLPVNITPLRTYLYGQASFWMEVICLQHLLIEYLEKYNFLKIADTNSIFAKVKSIMQLSHEHFFAHVKLFDCVSSKCLTGTLEIKVASAVQGTWNVNSQVPSTWKIKLEITWYVSSINM